MIDLTTRELGSINNRCWHIIATDERGQVYAHLPSQQLVNGKMPHGEERRLFLAKICRKMILTKKTPDLENRELWAILRRFNSQMEAMRFYHGSDCE